MATPDLTDLRNQLEAVLHEPTPITPRAHARRQTLIATLLCEAFRRRGLSSMLVGGSALEFYAPGAYVTGDIDMPVAKGGVAPSRAELDAVFSELGFRKGTARHWERDDVLVEVPNADLDEPSEEYQVGPYQLRVVAKEAVLVGRMVEYDQTGHTGHAAQAILMLRVFGDQFDRDLLARLVRQERVEGVYGLLREFAARSPEQTITDEELRMARDRLKGYTVYGQGADAAEVEENGGAPGAAANESDGDGP